MWKLELIFSNRIRFLEMLLCQAAYDISRLLSMLNSVKQPKSRCMAFTCLGKSVNSGCHKSNDNLPQPVDTNRESHEKDRFNRN